MAARLCLEPSCTELGNPRCPDHTRGRRAPARQRAQANRERDARRGTTAERGYGAGHQRTRAEWAPLVEAGDVDCWRCTRRIEPGQSWQLGHDDHDRSITRGPEHKLCNLRAAGRAPRRRT